jgi:D-ribose pyranose/furanose isomerase RbsD
LWSEKCEELANIERAEAIKIKIVTVFHEEFKKVKGEVKAVIRTGEFTP